MPHILIIDNHDSFVYNLVQLVREAEGSCPFTVCLASELVGDEAKSYDGLIISPGPGVPTDFPLMMQVLADFVKAEKPVLGICLGCQAIAMHFGYSLERLPAPLHGHTSYLSHRGRGILEGIDQGLAIGRYHSWVVDLAREGESQGVLVEEAYTNDRDGRHTMIVAHESLPIWGILFHPESIITEGGRCYIEHWLRLLS